MQGELGDLMCQTRPGWQGWPQAPFRRHPLVLAVAAPGGWVFVAMLPEHPSLRRCKPTGVAVRAVPVRDYCGLLALMLLILVVELLLLVSWVSNQSIPTHARQAPEGKLEAKAWAMGCVFQGHGPSQTGGSMTLLNLPTKVSHGPDSEKVPCRSRCQNCPPFCPFARAK